MSASRGQRKPAAQVCDGLCHCGVCQFLEPSEAGGTFSIGCGKKCSCGAFVLSSRCYLMNRKFYNCSNINSAAAHTAVCATVVLSAASMDNMNDFSLEECHHEARWHCG